MSKLKQFRNIKKIMKDTTAEMISNPNKILEQAGQTDTVKQIKVLAEALDESINMLQEHIIIVQKNQIAFQDYFKALHDKMEELEKSFNELKNK